MRQLFAALRLAVLFGLLFVPVPAPAGGGTPAVRQADPAYRIRFPEDEGSHPGFGEEWWYISGWLDGRDGDALGFQITFFVYGRIMGKMVAACLSLGRSSSATWL